MTAWDLYGGAGVFAAVLAQAVGDTGQGRHRRHVARGIAVGACGAGRSGLGFGGHRFRAPGADRAARRPDVAVLDPPRSGAGREVIDLLAAAEVPRVIHIGCEAASFARDVGLYRDHGYAVEELRVFDSFPLTHHVECVAGAHPLAIVSRRSAAAAVAADARTMRGCRPR